MKVERRYSHWKGNRQQVGGMKGERRVAAKRDRVGSEVRAFKFFALDEVMV